MTESVTCSDASTKGPSGQTIHLAPLDIRSSHKRKYAGSLPLIQRNKHQGTAVISRRTVTTYTGRESGNPANILTGFPDITKQAAMSLVLCQCHIIVGTGDNKETEYVCCLPDAGSSAVHWGISEAEILAIFTAYPDYSSSGITGKSAQKTARASQYCISLTFCIAMKTRVRNTRPRGTSNHEFLQGRLTLIVVFCISSYHCSFPVESSGTRDQVANRVS